MQICLQNLLHKGTVFPRPACGTLVCASAQRSPPSKYTRHDFYLLLWFQNKPWSLVCKQMYLSNFFIKWRHFKVCLRRQIVCSRTFHRHPQGTAWCDFKCLAFCWYANLLQNWMHQSIIYLVWPAALSCVLAHQHHRPQDTPITILTCIVLVSALFNKERTVPFGCGCACVLHVACCIFLYFRFLFIF